MEKLVQWRENLKRDVSTFSPKTGHPGKLTWCKFMTEKKEKKNILTQAPLATNCLKVSPRPRAYQD